MMQEMRAALSILLAVAVGIAPATSCAWPGERKLTDEDMRTSTVAESRVRTQEILRRFGNPVGSDLSSERFVIEGGVDPQEEAYKGGMYLGVGMALVPIIGLPIMFQVGDIKAKRWERRVRGGGSEYWNGCFHGYVGALVAAVGIGLAIGMARATR